MRQIHLKLFGEFTQIVDTLYTRSFESQLVADHINDKRIAMLLCMIYDLNYMYLNITILEKEEGYMDMYVSIMMPPNITNPFRKGKRVKKIYEMVQEYIVEDLSE